MALQPDSKDAVIADLIRRVLALETAQRTGLNQLRYSESTASASPSVFASPEFGTAGNTWADDKGGTGPGYPQLTMTLPARSFAIFHCIPRDTGNAPGFRSQTGTFFLKLDSDPFQFLVTYSSQSNIDRMYTPVIGVGILNVPGRHTITMGAVWTNNNPAAGTLPLLDEAKLYIIPTSAV